MWSRRTEQMEQHKCKDVKAATQRWMDPVSVCLNLWASQRIFKAGGGSGFVHWGEVFPGVPLDGQGQVKADPPHPDVDGPEQNPQMRERSDREYEATAGKYAEAPRWDWTTLSACEVVEWALSQFTGDREAMRSVLLCVHPDAGRFMVEDYPKDPFVACARRTLDSGATWRDHKDWARVTRSSYGAFRKVMWRAIGSKTSQDELGSVVDRLRYERTRRHLNAMDGKELSRPPETSVVESAS